MNLIQSGEDNRHEQNNEVNDIDKMLENISRNINNARIEKSLSFDQMSDLCHVSECTIRNIIYGQSKNHSIAVLHKICKGLDIKIVDLLE